MYKFTKITFKLLDLLIIFTMIFGAPMSALAAPSSTAATITAYSLPTDATVDISALQPDGSPSSGMIDGAKFSNVKYSAGTGVIDPFVRIQAGDNEQGYNSSSGLNKQFDETGKYASQYNHALALSAIPITYIYNPTTQQFDAYRQLLLDINENSNSNGEQYLSLDALQIYQSNSDSLSALLEAQSLPALSLAEHHPFVITWMLAVLTTGSHSIMT